MNQPQKLPPDKVEALASSLQSSLKRRRPRTWMIVVTTMLAAIAILALLAWWLRGTPEVPRLEVVAFDEVAAPDEMPHVSAMLAFPPTGEYDPSLLARHEVMFDPQAAALGGPQRKKATSDAQGRASVAWPLPEPQGEAFVVNYVDAPMKHGSNDDATLFRWERGGKVLLVEAEETLALGEPGQWEKTNPIDIAVRPGAPQALQALAKTYRIGYLAVSQSQVLAYRKLRFWVHAMRAEKDRFPSGPVFGRRDYAATIAATQARDERLSDLQQRFGIKIVLVARSAAALSAGLKLGMGAIALESDNAPEGSLRAPSWAEVVTMLNQHMEE